MSARNRTLRADWIVPVASDAWNVLVGIAQRDQFAGRALTHQRPDLRPLFSRQEIDPILHKLVEGGFLISSRGRQGGYVLFRRPEEITMWDVLELFGETRTQKEASPFDMTMRALRLHLKKITIADLLETEIDFEREKDMLEDLKSELQEVRKKSTKDGTRLVFPDDLKARIVAAADANGNATTAMILKLNVTQLSLWRREIREGRIAPVKTPEPTWNPSEPEPEVEVEEDPEPLPEPDPRECPEPEPEPAPIVRVFRRAAPEPKPEPEPPLKPELEITTEPEEETEAQPEEESAQDEEPTQEEPVEEEAAQEEAPAPVGGLLCRITRRDGTVVEIFDA